MSLKVKSARSTSKNETSKAGISSNAARICPDCIWAWTKSLSIRAAVLSTSQQSDVRANMDKATIVPCARQPCLREYVKEHVLNHAVSEQELVHVIESINLFYTKGSGASMAVRQLFHAGTLELRGFFCCWKDPVVSRSMRKVTGCWGYFFFFQRSVLWFACASCAAAASRTLLHIICELAFVCLSLFDH